MLFNYRYCVGLIAVIFSTLQFFSGAVFGQALEEIIVTAERRELNLQQTPISISAFNQLELDRLGLETTEDIANFIPNVSVGTAFGSGDQNATFSIRGAGQFRNTTFFDRGVGLYIDDMYYPRNSGAILRILDVERVEVLRGPQGTLFGRNSTGGAIRYISQQPEDEFNATVNLTGGTFARKDLKGHVNIPLGDRAAARITGASMVRDGYLKGENGQTKGNLDVTAIRAQLRFQPTDSLDINLSYATDSSKDNGRTGTYKGVDDFDPSIKADGMTGMSGREIAGHVPRLIYEEPTFGCYWAGGSLNGPCVTSTFNENDPSTYYSDAYLVQDGFYDYLGGTHDSRSSSNDFTTLNANWDMTDNITATLVAGSISGERDDIYDGDMSPLPILANKTIDTWDSSSVELRFAGEHDRLSWTAGLYTFTEKANSWNKTDSYDCSPMGMDIDLDSCVVDIGEGTEFIDSDASGIFAQVSYDITDRLGITVGLRSTEDTKGAGGWLLNEPDVVAYFGKSDIITEVRAATNDARIFRGNSWTSDDHRVVLDYEWNDDLFTYLSYSTAYKAGGFADFLGDDTGSNNVTVGRDGVAGTGDEGQPRFGLIPYDPEWVKGFEIGMRSEWLDQRLRLNVSLFDMAFTDRHIRSQDRFFQNPPFTANASNLDVDGIEIDAIFAATDSVRITAALGTLNSAYSGIDPSATGGVFNSTPRERMPALSGTLGFRHTANLANGGEFVTSANAAYTDDFYNGSSSNHQVHIDSYTQMTMRGEYWTPSGDWSITVSCSNCANDEIVRGATDMSGTRILPDGSIGGGGAGVGYNRWEIAAPRQFAINFGYYFNN